MCVYVKGVCVCVCMSVRACVRARMRARVCVRACVCARACVRACVGFLSVSIFFSCLIFLHHEIMETTNN